LKYSVISIAQSPLLFLDILITQTLFLSTVQGLFFVLAYSMNSTRGKIPVGDLNLRKIHVSWRNAETYFLCLVLCLILAFMPGQSKGSDPVMKTDKDGVMKLSEPVTKGRVTFEETLKRRESVRHFANTPLTREEISQLLWAGQGITRRWGGRTAPSAGALYPLELYIALPEGIFHYNPNDHSLILHVDQNVLEALSRAALGQGCVRDAPAVIVIASVYERLETKYGSRGERYAKIEVGHAAQNILLQAVSLGLGAVPVGAYYDEEVKKVLKLPPRHEPLYLIPVGHPSR
jgi:SagB-type dehydrogenase family enzyme